MVLTVRFQHRLRAPLTAPGLARFIRRLLNAVIDTGILNIDRAGHHNLAMVIANRIVGATRTLAPEVGADWTDHGAGNRKTRADETNSQFSGAIIQSLSISLY